jgi:hypothetical protein
VSRASQNGLQRKQDLIIAFGPLPENRSKRKPDPIVAQKKNALPLCWAVPIGTYTERTDPKENYLCPAIGDAYEC